MAVGKDYICYFACCFHFEYVTMMSWFVKFLIEFTFFLICFSFFFNFFFLLLQESLLNIIECWVISTKCWGLRLSNFFQFGRSLRIVWCEDNGRMHTIHPKKERMRTSALLEQFGSIFNFFFTLWHIQDSRKFQGELFLKPWDGWMMPSTRSVLLRPRKRSVRNRVLTHTWTLNW